MAARVQPQGAAGRRDDAGFMLIAVVVMVFLVLLALSVAAPRIATDLKRDREVESAHRANQYVRAIQVYYRKFGHYPGSIEQLEKSNNQRFLRQRYIDPLTGKDDWRLIHVGENKTKVKGFFGEDLPGLPAGLGAAAGLASPTGSSGSAFGSSSSAFGSPGTSGSSGSSFGQNSGSSFGQNSGSSFGANGASGSGSSASTTGSGTGSTSGSSGISSQNATDATGTGGPIMGIGSARTGEAILVVNEQTNYQEWEFLYDPRIELMKAKASLLGGIPSGAPGTGGFGTPIGTNPATPGTPPAQNGNPPASPTNPQ